MSPATKKASLLSARFPARLRARAAQIEVCGFDSDGSLTERGMYHDSQGTDLRRFDVRDGIAMKWAVDQGLGIVVVSGRASRALDYRMEDLGLPVFQNVKDKVAVLEEFCAQRGVKAERVAFLGDDLPDLAALRWCGLPMAVADAHPEILRAAAWVTPSAGGRGAAREALEALLDASGRWEAVLAHYRGGKP
ncbi:MAG TPA: HAD hydrolase family protein [Candidatus Eisenbacteria bacterium]|nr:HAD hydrolase family protein [Candidatus Eisenbacteria bacterium]